MKKVQTGFGGSITDEKFQDTQFFACSNQFPKYPTKEKFERANGPYVVKFFKDYQKINYCVSKPSLSYKARWRKQKSN